MENKYLRGGIYLAELDECLGSEQRGCRPVMVIQNNTGNKYSSTLIIAPLTSEINGKSSIPTHYHIGVTNGLFKDSMVLLEQIRTIDKSRIIHYIGRISKKHINGINKALGISVGLYDTVPIFLCGKCAKTLHSSGAFFLKKANNGTSIEHCVLCKKEKAKVYEISLYV